MAAPAKPDTAAGSSPAIPDQPFPHEPGDEAQDRQPLIDYINEAPSPPKDNWEEYKEAFAKTPTGRFITDIGNALTLPGRVYSRGPVDLTDGYGYDELAMRQQQDIKDATNLAGFAGGGAPIVAAGRQTMGALARRAATPEVERVLASRNERQYSAPQMAQRAFEDDYKPGALQNVADEAGKLLRDIDGRPLGDQTVVGRRSYGGPDEAISPEELVATVKGPTRTGYQSVPASALRKGEVGRFEKVAGPDAPEYSILVKNGMEPKNLYRVLGHEFSHYLDAMTGDISTKGLTDQFRKIYNTMNTGQVRDRALTGPQHFGYKGADIERELVAEAIRAYMENPNYLKATFPDVAKRLRKNLNSNPRVNKYIQFNSAAPPPLGAVLGLNTDQDEPSSPLLDVMAPRRQ